MTSADEPLLLDSYLREYDVAEVHACIVSEDVKATWEAIRRRDLALDTPAFATLPGGFAELPEAHGDQAPHD